MFDLSLFLANLGLCSLAIAAAAFVRPGREEAVWLAVLLLGNFVFCALAYTPYAPKYALSRLGVTVTSKELWMLADALYGCAAVLAFRRWWAWLLWGLAIGQVALHIGYQYDLFDAEHYSDRLTTMLHAQIAVFFLIGGRGLVVFLSAAFGRMRDILTASAVARPSATTRGMGRG